MRSNPLLPVSKSANLLQPVAAIGNGGILRHQEDGIFTRVPEPDYSNGWHLEHLNGFFRLVDHVGLAVGCECEKVPSEKAAGRDRATDMIGKR